MTQPRLTFSRAASSLSDLTILRNLQSKTPIYSEYNFTYESISEIIFPFEPFFR
jgi:hypothetical protein